MVYCTEFERWGKTFSKDGSDRFPGGYCARGLIRVLVTCWCRRRDEKKLSVELMRFRWPLQFISSFDMNVML